MVENISLDKLKMMGYSITDIDTQLILANKHSNVRVYLRGIYIGEETLLSRKLDVYKYGDAYMLHRHIDYAARANREEITQSALLVSSDGVYRDHALIYEDEENWLFTKDLDETTQVKYCDKKNNKKYHCIIANNSTTKFKRLADGVIIANYSYINFNNRQIINLANSKSFGNYIAVAAGKENVHLIDINTGELKSAKFISKSDNVCEFEIEKYFKNGKSRFIKLKYKSNNKMFQTDSKICTILLDK